MFPLVVCAVLDMTPTPKLAREDWQAAFASQPAEFARVPLRQSGKLPMALLGGTLYKNGPANFERGGVKYAHWLDGDGYVTALHFTQSGEAVWSGRYVRTTAFDQEMAADAVLYRTTFGTQRPGGPLANAFDVRLKSPANTNLLPFGDALLALWEAGPPYELDPQTLAYKGTSSLGGRLRLSGEGTSDFKGHGALPGTTSVRWLDEALEAAGLLTDACSAHPREDEPDRRATIAWSWRQRLVGSPAIEIALHTLPHDESSASTTVPSSPPPPVRALLDDVAFAPHDMALSRTYALFVTSPTAVDLLPYLLGLRGPAECTHFVRGTPMPGSKIHLVRRTVGEGASGAIVVDIGRAFHPVHHANAWEEGGDALEEEAATARSDPITPKGQRQEQEPRQGQEQTPTRRQTVRLISSCWPPEAVERLSQQGSSLLGSWADLVSGDFSKVPMTNLVRFSVDLETRRVTEHTVLASGVQLDHPRVHPRWATRRTRFVFGTLGRRDNGGVMDSEPVPPQSFGCVDVSGEGALVDAWFAGERRLVDEATLIPMSTADGLQEDVDERAVWLLAPVFDGATRRTSYVVLDGRALARGPVCECELDTHVPWGLHGAWVGGSPRERKCSGEGPT
jgi:all-trans-8'-apo-beta-carotenal 15,15'-oxygenase